MSLIDDIDSPVARVCAEVTRLGPMAIVGWTKDVQWLVYGGSVVNVRMFYGSKRFSFFVTPDSQTAIYADDGMFPMIASIIDDIYADIVAQHARLVACPDVIRDFSMASLGLKAETFPKWSRGLSREAREDPLHQVLFDKYRQEYEAAEASFQKRMRDAFFSQCRTRGARYVSVNATLFCVLEDVRTDGVTGKPVVHQIAEDLNFFAGSFENFGVRTMNLYTLFGRDIEGIWRVDGDQPIYVRDHTITESNRGGYKTGFRAILRGKRDADESEWLNECGAVQDVFSRY